MSKPIIYTIHWSQFIFSAVIVFVTVAIIILSIVSTKYTSTNITNSTISNNSSCSTNHPDTSNFTKPTNSNYISNCIKWLKIDGSNKNADIILGKSSTLIKCQELCEQDHVCLRNGFAYDEGNSICYYDKSSPQYFNNSLNTTKFYFCVKDECKNNPCLNNATCVEKDIQYFCDCKNTGYFGENCSEKLAFVQLTSVQPNSVYKDTFMSSYHECLYYVDFINAQLSYTRNVAFYKYSDEDNYCLIYLDNVLNYIKLLRA